MIIKGDVGHCGLCQIDILLQNEQKMFCNQRKTFNIGIFMHIITHALQVSVKIANEVKPYEKDISI